MTLCFGSVDAGKGGDCGELLSISFRRSDVFDGKGFSSTITAAGLISSISSMEPPFESGWLFLPFALPVLVGAPEATCLILLFDSLCAGVGEGLANSAPTF